jgi:hypothetical protein
LIICPLEATFRSILLKIRYFVSFSIHVGNGKRDRDQNDDIRAAQHNRAFTETETSE